MDGTPTWPKLRLGLEHLQPGFNPGQNPDSDSNPRSRDLNPATTNSLPNEITHLVSGLNEAQVLDISLQKEFSEKQSDM